MRRSVGSNLPLSCAPPTLDPHRCGINTAEWRGIEREIIKGIKRARDEAGVERARAREELGNSL